MRDIYGERRGGWRHTLKVVAVTFLVTSAAWLVGGAILFERWRAEMEPAGARLASAAPVALRGAAKAQPTVAAAAMVPANARGLIIPVAGIGSSQLVDTFTAARSGGRRHDAIDIMAPRGTPVLAAAAGRVDKLFVSGQGGNTVYVRSPDRTLIYYYAHLDAYAPGLAEGVEVRQGQQIGTVGFTGDASPDGPHLHFEIQQTNADAGWWQHTGSLNPYPLLVGR